MRAAKSKAGNPSANPGRKIPSQKPGTSGTTLIAVVGTSPAILTETVWKLAQGDEKCSPVIPEEVIAITTLRGQESIKAQLQTPTPEFGGRTVWQALRQELLGARASNDNRLTLRVAVIERPDPATGGVEYLEDIRDQSHNLAAADFMLKLVREHTSSNDRRLVASLAGGRKTMGALLHAAFSHLGRPQDRLTHILVDEPFDGGLQPLFFYPAQPTQTLTARNGKQYQALKAKIELAEVPFAPLRLRFPDIADVPTRYRDLVQTYVETFKRDAAKPALIELKSGPPRVTVDGKTVELESERQFAVVEFLLLANQKEWLEKNQDEALEIFKAWHGYAPQFNLVRSALRPTIEKLYHDRSKKPGPDWVKSALKEDIKRPLSFWRRALVRTGSLWLPPLRDLRFPPFKMAKDS